MESAPKCGCDYEYYMHLSLLFCNTTSVTQHTVQLSALNINVCTVNCECQRHIIPSLMHK